ncbi:MAG: adenylylsulfate kinase [Omnitrophica WOR_2 bacterium SM23_29]|nr:MAG: adenylylsulfate kinase [Omnitrophica WOR_2 bacterium SM23_29]
MLKEKNIVWHPHRVNQKDREKIKEHKSCVIWFTGLPSSGKSTIAHELEYGLNKRGKHTYVLDGDNIRHGLNRNLGFSREDRKENIRRIGEVVKLFVDAGIVTIAAFISPFRKDREAVRNLLKDGEFIEIYTKCPIEVCMERDPKNLYKKAMAGEIKEFTGISQPYEEPLNSEIMLETDKLSVSESVNKILNYLKSHKIINAEEQNE